MKRPALLAWSSGKDSEWALHRLRAAPDIEVVRLLTTFNQSAGRVAMHAVRRELVEAQARALGLPLQGVELPWPCSNEVYEERMLVALADARAIGVEVAVFGDLHLADVRAYRERQLDGLGIAACFPLWTDPGRTRALAGEMVAAGLRAIVTCVDPRQLDPCFIGRTFDAQFLADLPPQADPCGERGEFHTFCYAGPMFRHPLAVRVGEVVERDGFWFADVTAA